jgi:NhaP-type Na+/H+ or K+/H+ antiporter
MPLSILGCALLGWWLLGLGIGAALLLGAVLAPTDPVLAGEVQVGEPDDPDEPEDEARFSLTSEAGLNDALAFPFVYAAIAISMVGADPSGWLADWLLVDVAWRLTVGTLVGLAAGWLLSRLFFRSRLERARLADQAEGFVALAATLLAYGFAELCQPSWAQSPIVQSRTSGMSSRCSDDVGASCSASLAWHHASSSVAPAACAGRC